jgi:hypothetical protein
MSYVLSFEKKPLSVGAIASSIPEIQREVNKEAIDAIYEKENTFYETRHTYIIPGCISICKVKETNKEYIIDGQHRMIAYTNLSKNFPERPLIIHVDYYTVTTYRDLELLYADVNRCTPHPVTTLGIDNYKAIEYIKSFFSKTFPTYISKSNNPHIPNINLEVLADCLYKKKVVEKTNCSGEQLVEKMCELNKWYASKSEKQFAEWHVDMKHLYIVLRNPNKLYLGLYKYNWIDRLLDLHKANWDLSILNKLHHVSPTYRPKITKMLQREVWGKYGVTTLTQPCFSCKQEINRDSFECGHVVPVVHGGKTNLKNLEPICRECNSDMGCMNMNDYIALQPPVSPVKKKSVSKT